MKNIFNETVPTTPHEILDNAPLRPCGPNAVLLAFSGGNDSRTMAHLVKPYFDDLPYKLELAAIETGLGMDGWEQSVIEFSEWIGLPVSFWKGEGQKYYTDYVEARGWPGNAAHSEVQNHLKGRAYRKMVYDRRIDTEKPSKAAGVAVWILSGIRKYESQKRLLLKSPYSYREGAQFINPLFYWTNANVVDYMIEHDIPESPGIQWDCKCGATVKNADIEWNGIKSNAPCLRRYLESLENPAPWTWGSFDKSAHARMKQVDNGQMWLDDGSIESFPTCINCWRDLVADEESAMEEWQ